MKFCGVCKNMYYITMGDAPGSGPEEATTKILIHKCRNCGNEEKKYRINDYCIENIL